MKNRIKSRPTPIENFVALVFSIVVLRYGKPDWLQYLALIVCVINIWGFVWSIDD